MVSPISEVELASSLISSSKCWAAASPVRRLVRLFGRTGSASGTSASARNATSAPFAIGWLLRMIRWVSARMIASALATRPRR